MRRLFKWVFYLAVAAFVVVAVYAYVGPLFGVDLAPARSEVRIPVEFSVD